MNTITNSHYIHMGIIMLIVSCFIFIILQTYFLDQIEYSNGYTKDMCVIDRINFKKTTFNCWSDAGNVNEVTLPCLEVYVNTSKFENLIFYRSIQEKLIIKANNLNVCTYVPTACENHPNYLKSILEESLLELFPPLNFRFECFVSSQNEKSCTNQKVVSANTRLPVTGSTVV